MKDRRTISGARILCRCSLDLPKPDPFAVYTTKRSGLIIFNVRGGSLYLFPQISGSNAQKIFYEGKVFQANQILFTCVHDASISACFSNFHMRYVGERKRGVVSGLIFRFVNLTETQMDELNELLCMCPSLSLPEEVEVLKKKKWLI